MRIAFVSEHASPLAVVGGVDAGGQNVHVAALASHLADRGHEVTVFTRRDDTSLANRVPFGAGVTVEHLAAGPAAALPKDELWTHMPEFAARLRRRLQADRPDVVHAHFWMSGWAAVRARPAGVPVVHTFHALGAVKRRHQGRMDTSPPARHRVERMLCRTVDRIVATCSDEAAELALLGAPAAAVDVVPCGVDLHRFTPEGSEARLRDGRDETTTPASAHQAAPRPRLLMVGRLVPRKGLGDAVRALAEVPGAELFIAGGPDRARLAGDEGATTVRAAAAAAGVADRVHLLGRVARPDMPDLLRSADVVLCPPWYEPFGIVPLEAMACGRPVVATAVGGMLDTVHDGVTGLLVPPRRPTALAAAVRALLDDPRRRARMGAAGRARVERRYAWQRVAADTEAAYERVLAGVRPEVVA